MDSKEVFYLENEEIFLNHISFIIENLGVSFTLQKGGEEAFLHGVAAGAAHMEAIRLIESGCIRAGHYDTFASLLEDAAFNVLNEVLGR